MCQPNSSFSTILMVQARVWPWCSLLVPGSCAVRPIVRFVVFAMAGSYVFKESFVKTVDRLATALSVLTSGALFALCLAGFSLVKAREKQIDNFYITVFAFVGCGLSVMLLAAEFNFAVFYRYFGILKTRIGRASTYFFVGLLCVMWSKESAAVKTWPPISTGVGCFVTCATHFVAIFVVGAKDEERWQWATQGRAQLARAELDDLDDL